jgi:hypothetical protein
VTGLLEAHVDVFVRGWSPHETSASAARRRRAQKA